MPKIYTPHDTGDHRQGKKQCSGEKRSEVGKGRRGPERARWDDGKCGTWRTSLSMTMWPPTLPPARCGGIAPLPLMRRADCGIPPSWRRAVWGAPPPSCWCRAGGCLLPLSWRSWPPDVALDVWLSPSREAENDAAGADADDTEPSEPCGAAEPPPSTSASAVVRPAGMGRMVAWPRLRGVSATLRGVPAWLRCGRSRESRCADGE